MKKKFKIFLVLFLSFVFFLNFGFYASAAKDGCSVEKGAFEGGKAMLPNSLLRTGFNTIGPMPNIVGFTLATGVNPDTAMQCQQYVMNNLDPAVFEIPDEYVSCEVDPAEENDVNGMCAALSSDVLGVQKYKESGGSSVLVDSIDGSLIGLGTMIESAALREPVPVNFAYYWNQNVSKIPFAGKALAADSDGYENLPVIKAVYDIWYLAVKVALALLSLVLLYTGIMITMGKKISNQLVVSVQYAIPKIVIGTVLIIFSYPIGAAITSISFGLFRGAGPMVYSAVLGTNNIPSGLPMLALILKTFSLARGGWIYIILSTIVLLILQILKIILYFKVLIIYLKMAVSIVTAPLEFVMGTIPGNDDKIRDWFLRMAKYGLSIFFMGLVVPVTFWVAMKLMAAYSISGDGAAEVGGWGAAFSLITPVLVVIFGFGMGFGMEKRVDEMLGGGKKR